MSPPRCAAWASGESLSLLQVPGGVWLPEIVCAPRNQAEEQSARSDSPVAREAVPSFWKMGNEGPSEVTERPGGRAGVGL